MASSYWQGGKIRLRPIEARDIELFEQFDEEVERNLDEIHLPQTKEGKREWVDKQIRQRLLGDGAKLIAVNAEDVPVGMIEIFNCNRRYGTLKYGVAVAKPYRGNGYAREMILLALRYYFMEMGYQKATPHVYSFNRASIGLHEKMGFVKEGRLRNMLYSEGEFHDEIHFGMTRDEFASLYGKGAFGGPLEDKDGL